MASEFSVVTTAQLRSRFDTPGLRLIDVRPSDAYNGWALGGESRGGHIPGARSLPAKWSTYLDWLDIVKGKTISSDDPLLLYGYSNSETERVAARFERAGFTDLAVYHSFVDEWSTRSDLPVERLERYKNLVPAQWLNSLLTDGKAPEYDNSKYLVCHAHYQNRSDYEMGHIPGAADLDTNSLESPKTWNRRSSEEIREALKALGVTHDTTVILYGRFSFPDNNDPFPGSSAGHLGAIRCAFILLYAGVRDVRILNGGLQAWLDEGFAVTDDEVENEAVDSFGARIPGRPEIVVDMPEAREILQSEEKNLVSVRSWREYVGEVSGYNYIEKKGRIPGSVFGNCGSDAYHMENYRNLDHTTREYHEIAALWKEVGVTRDKFHAFYCGTGWRASEAFLNAWLMGWPNVAVFDGGWFEWSSDETNPIASGVPV